MNEICSLHNKDCMAFMKDIEDNAFDLTLTDIPYSEVSRASGGLRVLNKGDADLETFDLALFVKEVIRVTKKSIYIFCGSLQISHILQMMRDESLSTRSCVWEKNNPPIMNGDKLWLSSIEHCAFGRKPNATFNGKCLSTVWRFPIFRNDNHPTPKPPKLFKYLIETSSDEGDSVFDPCMGSGTTGVACLEAGRKFVGVELNKTFFDYAKKRIDHTTPNLFF